MLKHLPFFAALASRADSAPTRESRESLAFLLSLRIVDMWFESGADAVSPDSLCVTETRNAIANLGPSSAPGQLLFRLLGAIQTLPRIDTQPILGILFACGEILVGAGQLEQAADAFATTMDFAHPEVETGLHVDAALRIAFCRRELGLLEDAEWMYTLAGEIAEWHNDHARAIRSSIGRAAIVRMRGDLPACDEMLNTAIADARSSGSREAEVIALIDQGTLAHQMGDTARAICLSNAALDLTASDRQSEKIFGNVGAFLLAMGRIESARDALLIQEAIASSERLRTTARINLLIIARRNDDHVEFMRLRKCLESAPMGAEQRVNYMIESAIAFDVFGDGIAARDLFCEAVLLAETLGLNRALFEAEVELSKQGNPDPGSVPDGVSLVEKRLRVRALALAA